MQGDLREILEYYSLIQAAKYLNVSPWDLMEQPTFWKEKALIAMEAESEARDAIEKFEEQRARSRG